MKKSNFFVSCFGNILEIFGNKKPNFFYILFLYIIKDNIYSCTHCIKPYDKNKKLQKLQKLQKIKNNLKIIFEIIEMEKVAKNYKEYFCKYCNYKCCNKTNFEKHLTTQKHKKQLLEKKQFLEISGNKEITTNFVCFNCKKNFKSNSGLWKHNKKCEKNTFTELLKKIDEKDKTIKEQNDELKEKDKTIKDMIPKIGNNNNNQNFNISIFLNEDCKGAINMSDFIKSIKVSTEQLEYTTKNGLQKGLSNVILENMNKLSLNERPVHCTDARRDTMYIKDNNVWEKDQDKTKIKEAINKVSCRNYNALSEWSKDNPDFMKNDKKQEFYAKTITTIGKKVDDNKIIKDVSKETYIDIKNI